MAIKPAFAVAAAALAALAFAAPAQADLQTWRLTATSYQVQGGFTAPAFAEVGNSFTIDYVIDTQTPSFDGWPGMFSDAVKSFTINGVTSQSEGYISAHGGLNAINIWPSDARSDGIDFISFNNFAGEFNADVASALKEFATFASTSSTDLRVDFGDKSIWAKPSSFVMTSSVPEPSTAWLLLVGLPLLAVGR
jgi:hypothetical protein